MNILNVAAEAAGITFFVVILPIGAARVYDAIRDRKNKKGKMKNGSN